MLNVLIIGKDIIQTQFLVNDLSQSIPEFRIYHIESRGIDSIDIISSRKPDLILLDLDLPDISGIDIIKYIEKNHLYNYLNSVIIFSDAIDTTVKLNSYVHSCFSKPINYKQLKNTIISIVNERKSNKISHQKIINELTQLKFNFSHIGTKYLVECIQIISEKNLYTRFNLTKDVYPIIAEKHNTNINTIKCNIFTSTLYSYYECDENFISNYYRIYPLDKPTPKYVIDTILSKL